MVKKSRRKPDLGIDLANNYAGRILVLEGSDGSGKSTQTKKLEKKLLEMGIPVAFFKFPRHGQAVFGRIVDDYLAGRFGDPTKLDPYFSASLYASDRREVLGEIREAQKAGRLILMDRYVGSNLAHQTAKIKGAAAKKKFMAWLLDLEHVKLGLPKADWTLYFSVSDQTSWRLLSGAEKNRDGHEANRVYLSLVKKEFNAIAKKSLGWHIIRCEEKGLLLPVEVIFKSVKNLLNI